VLLHAAGRSRDGGVPLAVSAVSHQVQRLLELSETADTFRIVQPR
jgi:anti-anti-sigma regulatory factor